MPARKTARKSAKTKASSAPRASWKGNLAFGLVNFPVHAINAINREGSDIHFHQLHATCHRRIQYKKVCPEHGEVSQDEIVSGYEVTRGKYVEVSRDELEELHSERENGLTIDAFIEPEAIDPLYFDGRMYYLVPEGESASVPYSVILHAMEREEKYGVGKITLSEKEQIALVRPLDGVLHMAMLNYDKELRPPEKVIASALPKPDSRQMKLAQTLIRNWTTSEFDFPAYEDEHREQLKDLIRAKSKGKKVTAEEEEPEDEPQIVNLMDALKRSIESKKRPTTKPRRKAARRKTG